MHTDIEIASEAAPAKVQPYLFAMQMMEEWARLQHWSSATMAATYLAPFCDMPQLTAAFMQAAQRVHQMLPDEEYGSTWTLSDIFDDVCAPFGAWVAAHTIVHDWPPEPAETYYLQSKLSPILTQAGGTLEGPLVVAVTLRVPAGSRAAAMTAAEDWLALVPPDSLEGLFSRFWLLDSVWWAGSWERWCIPAYIEVQASDFDHAHARAIELLAPRFGAVGVGFEFLSHPGRVQVTRSYPGMRRRDLPVQCLPGVVMPAAGGSLPTRWHR